MVVVVVEYARVSVAAPAPAHRLPFYFLGTKRTRGVNECGTVCNRMLFRALCAVCDHNGWRSLDSSHESV